MNKISMIRYDAGDKNVQCHNSGREQSFNSIVDINFLKVLQYYFYPLILLYCNSECVLL